MSAPERDERRLQRIELFKQATHPSSEWQYSFRDVILYALSIGCRRTEREFVYENDGDFATLPSFAVVAVHKAKLQYQDLLPNFDPRMLLHGEQYVEVFCPLPINGKFVVKPSLVDIQDKGKAALVITRASIVDPDTSKVYAINDVTAFVRNSGGFGRTKPVARIAAATAVNKPPQRSPDAVIEEQTSPDLAALYRLNADYNPLHIDPAFSSKGGFEVPILHGLCSFGISTKHVMQQYGKGKPNSIKSIKAQFAMYVFPGETLRTEMWQEGPDKVIFQTRVLERDVLAITKAAAELTSPSTSKL
ncbi:TPA: hypothetical protein ACH3X2_001601 [Trebouxia sp. C0005]